MSLTVNLQSHRQTLNNVLDQILIFLHWWAFLIHLLQPAHFPLYVKVWLEPETGQDKWRKTAAENKKEIEKEKKMHLICPPSPCFIRFSRTLSVSLFSRTCLNTQHSEGCWLTANSNCPEAKGSHLQTGPFIFPWKRKWSLAMILNHPPAAVLQGHQGSPVTNTSAYLHVREGTVTWSARGTEGQVRWADKRWTEHSLSPRWKLELWFVLQPHPSKWKWGIHVDVAVSCSERRDQRIGTGKMRVHKGRRKRKGGRGESGDWGGRQKYPFLTTRRRGVKSKSSSALCTLTSPLSLCVSP